MSDSRAPGPAVDGEAPAGSLREIAERFAAERSEARPAEPATAPGSSSSVPPPSGSEADEFLGQLIDSRYLVENLLDVGSMGIVYAGRHLAVGRRVAIKILRRQFLSDPDVSRRFMAEATAATAIGNAHIVDTLDCGTLPNGALYQIMEFLEGCSLGEALRAGGALPLERVLSIGSQVAVALAAAHEAGIVHRDLKPDNVFLVSRPDGADFVKILDFGIAKFGAVQNTLTHAGAVFGTPNYMAPEQALGRSTDPRTDIYALGVILYQMTAGSVPFEGDSPVAVLARHATESPLPLTDRTRGVPRRFELAVKKCLAKEPPDRFQSMSELAEELAAIAGHAEPPASARAVLPPRTPSAPPARRAPRPALARTLWVGAGVALLVLGAYAVGRAGRAPANASAEARAQSLERVARRSEAPPVTGSRSEPSPPASLPAPPAVPAPSAAPAKPGQDVALVLFPLDAHAVVDGRDLGPMPVTVRVPEGQELTAIIRRHGYWSRRITLDGTKSRLVVGLVKRVPGSKPPAGYDAPESVSRPSRARPRRH